MRVNGVLATALYSSAALLGQVRAEEFEEASTTTVAESSTTSEIEKPTFTVRKAIYGAARVPTFPTIETCTDTFNSHQR